MRTLAHHEQPVRETRTIDDAIAHALLGKPDRPTAMFFVVVGRLGFRTSCALCAHLLSHSSTVKPSRIQVSMYVSQMRLLPMFCFGRICRKTTIASWLCCRHFPTIFYKMLSRDERGGWRANHRSGKRIQYQKSARALEDSLDHIYPVLC